MKRYVLTKDKTILDRNKAQDFSVYDREPIKLQSDNLIDLAEVGDMVEIVDEQGLDYIHLTEEWTVCEIMEDFEVIAIWKHNGDVMRRYER